MRTFIILPLYYSETNALFYRIIEVKQINGKSFEQTINTINLDTVNENNIKIPSLEYDRFRSKHHEDIFYKLGRIPITKEYYDLIKLYSKQNDANI